MQTGGFELAQEATVPVSSVSPRPVRDTGFALAGWADPRDLAGLPVRLHRPEDQNEETMEKEFGLPVLTSVPRVAAGWRLALGAGPRD